MTGGSTPRPNGLLLFEAHRRAVAYRLAMVTALRELNPRNCTACRRAEMILQDVDQVTSAPPITLPPVASIPEPRAPVGDTMDTWDVAIAFGVDVKTVKKWIAADKIPSFLDARGRRRFDTALIDALLD